jgi:hypothetical protein
VVSYLEFTGSISVLEMSADMTNSADYVFDLPDVVASFNIPGKGEYDLEAYGSRKNAAILDSNELQSKRLALRWVSDGCPSFVSRSNGGPEGEQLFHFTPQLIYTHIRTLTDEQKGEPVLRAWKVFIALIFFLLYSLYLLNISGI